MAQAFDQEFWERHWQAGRPGDAGSMGASPPNPYLVGTAGSLTPGTALDAGCGAGAEAIWLAAHGWRVVAADISSGALALARAAERAVTAGTAERVQWVEADLGVWDPGRRFDLVVTHYAHPAMPQLELYERIAEWVAPGGTLLIVAHGPARSTGHGDHPPAEASVSAATITARLDPTWEIVTAAARGRTITGPAGRPSTLHDVVVRAIRRPTTSAEAP